MGSISLSGVGSTSQRSNSALDQLMRIREGGGTPAEKKEMLRALQAKMEGERVQQLMVSMNKIEVKPKEKLEEQANEDGDTVQISDASQQQYELSTSDSGTTSSSSSDGSSGSVSVEAN